MPPLNALKAFEAAARHESFAKSAEELGVTAAAVSQHVKALEQWLGAPLFERRARGLHLTEAGRRALPGFIAAFDAMGDAVQSMRGLVSGRQLSIAALPSVAQLWLAPRLPALRRAFPGLRPSVHALEEVPNFRREPFDLAIFFVGAAPEGMTAHRIADDIIFPVCAPSLAAELRSPSDLARVQLVVDTSWRRDWPIWLKAAGVSQISIEDGLGFSLFSLALQAATDGAGVLVGHHTLVAEPLAAGTVVAPFEIKARTGACLTVLAPANPPSETLAVMEWLAGSADQAFASAQRSASAGSP